MDGKHSSKVDTQTSSCWNTWAQVRLSVLCFENSHTDVIGAMQTFQYSAQDVFYSQLASSLEGIASGTTTIVDHAHITCSPEHAKLGIAGTASSGIRSVFCYTPIMRLKGFNPISYHENPLEEWVMKTFEELADDGPFGAGRVTLGFAFDLFFLPDELVLALFAQVKNKGIKTITCHGSVSMGNVIQSLTKLDLLDERIIISHGGNISKDEAKRIKISGAHLSCTPSTELQMSMGRPYCFDASFLDGGASGQSTGLQDNASLGVDCHSCTAGSIVSEAKLGLQNARVEAAFNLATIKGAEAVNMSNEIGRIAEGYKVDLVIFDALSPAMIGAAQHDPVAAVILHSSPADIDTVIVDGIVRKSGGKLLPVQVDDAARQAVGVDTLAWPAVAKEIVESRARIQEKINAIDFHNVNETLHKMFRVEEGRVVDV
jgi:cytosine/adenosine deaminase-related metal-dependent hydrolase